jgi:hypothetical protein
MHMVEQRLTIIVGYVNHGQTRRGMRGSKSEQKERVYTLPTWSPDSGGVHPGRRFGVY